MSAADLDQRIAEVSKELNNMSFHLLGLLDEKNRTKSKMRDLRWELGKLQEAKANES